MIAEVVSEAIKEINERTNKKLNNIDTKVTEI